MKPRKKNWSSRQKFNSRGYNFYRKKNFGGSSFSSRKSFGSAPKKKLSFRAPKKASLQRIITVVFIFVFLYIIYHFFYSNAFKITSVSIQGTENVSEYALRNIIEEQMNRSRFLIFSQDNLLLFNKGKAKENIKNSYVFEELEINKEFPHTLAIKIKEKVSTVIWITEGEEKKHYYLDLNGVVLGEIPPEEAESVINGEKLTGDDEEQVVNVEDLENSERAETNENGGEATIFPVIHDLSGETPDIKEQVLDADAINFIISLAVKFPEVIDGKSIKYFATPEANTTRIHALTEEGWEAYFESTKDLDKQLNNLHLVLNEKIRDLSKIQYIDLRFDERIYYK